ncbi:hypothetical protein [Flagellimonas meridianipacifica]|uniref:YARHG domain-containing protein n=1 Tax=Flagellimonas meridianipacifica TaxID=1080225 RepID=A0A2T0MB35_9FLAO|nr:hypothetical protein [Allomuricauda pacifica]PRX54697.1 hypothetical protein CLV81_3101 [Allomuricauda pacifica]
MIKSLLLSCFSLFLGFLVVAQNNKTEVIEGYVAFDAVVGIENTDLSQGVLYLEKYRTINDKKQFFKSSDFEKGDIWYKGQPYYEKPLKYDAHHDQILVQIQSQSTGQRATLQLFKSEIDSFNLLEHRFIHLNPSKENESLTAGFYESLYQKEELRLFVRHSKNRVQLKGKSFVYYEFPEFKKQYLLSSNKEFYSLNSKKEILEAFKIDKKDLNPIYKELKRKYKDQNKFMVELVKQIGSIP